MNNIVICYLCKQKNRILSTLSGPSGIRCGACGALLIDIVKCTRCGTKNRIEIRLAEHQKIVCGKCKAVLKNYHLEDAITKTSHLKNVLMNALKIEGKLYQWKGEWEEAIQLFQEATQYSPDALTAAMFAISIGFCHAYLGNDENASAYLAHINDADVAWDDFQVVHELARAYGLLGDLAKAMLYFEKARTLLSEKSSEHHLDSLLTSLYNFWDTAPSDSVALQTSVLICDAICDYETDHFQAGVRKLRRALELDPTNPVIYHQLGIGLVHQREFEDAMTILEQGLERDPTYEQAQFALGDAYFHLGLYELALNAYKQTLHLNPHNINAYHHLGLVYEQRGEIEVAKEYWEDVLKVDPFHEQALNCLSRYAEKVSN